MKPVKIYNDVNRFVIDWTLNTLCTYKCSYCPPTLNSGKNLIYDKDNDSAIVKNFLTKLHNEIKGQSVHVFLNGGEPTISHSFETIIDFCNDVGWCSYVNTNCSRTIDWWKRWAPKIFKVTVSYHPEFADDEIFGKVKIIGELTNVGVFTLMYPPFWTKAKQAFEKFKTYSNIALEPSRVFKRNASDASVSYEYSEEQVKWLNENSGLNIRGSTKPPPKNNYYGKTYIEYDNGEAHYLDEVLFVNTRRNSFKGWQCFMGTENIWISGNGDIKDSACPQAKVFSTIKDFNGLKTTPVICKMDWCMCTSDVLLSKVNIGAVKNGL